MTQAGDTAGMLERVRLSANGLLSLKVYQRLFDLAQSSKGGTFIEIGTAHGAATIALALGALASGKAFHIFTVDPFSGRYSSRTRFGSVDDNLKFVRSQFDAFGVGDYITIVVGGVDDLLSAHSLHDVSLLFLDADGRIDRDLAALFTTLSPACKIIIDDIDNAVYVSEINGLRVVDQKHRIGSALVNAFVANNVLQPEMTVINTGFFTKGGVSITPDEIRLVALPAYRELVFAEIPPPAPPKLTSLVWNHVPGAAGLYRLLRHGQS